MTRYCDEFKTEYYIDSENEDDEFKTENDEFKTEYYIDDDNIVQCKMVKCKIEKCKFFAKINKMSLCSYHKNETVVNYYKCMGELLPYIKHSCKSCRKLKCNCYD